MTNRPVSFLKIALAREKGCRWPWLNMSSSNLASRPPRSAITSHKIGKLEAENETLKSRLVEEIYQQENAQANELSDLKAMIVSLESESNSRLSELASDNRILQERLAIAERKCGDLHASHQKLSDMHTNTRSWASKTMWEVTKHEEQPDRLDSHVRKAFTPRDGVMKHSDLDFTPEDTPPHYDLDDPDDVFDLPPMLPALQAGQPESSEAAKGKQRASKRAQSAAFESKPGLGPTHSRNI